jgi:predicted O-methyltransferase YrrM
LKKKSLKNYLNRVRHVEDSRLCSVNSNEANDYLINLSLRAVEIANRVEILLPQGSENYADRRFANIFPGEHYRLLQALSSLLTPTLVVEIGTSTGLGTLSLLQGMAGQGQLHTFDLNPWDQYGWSYLTKDLFTKGRVMQHLADVSDRETYGIYRSLFEGSDIIFLDAPKDGVMEYKFMDCLKTLNFPKRKLLIVDDIRLPNMIEFWQRIQSPKLDLVSFGHWSGTGLVDISKGLGWDS